MSFSQSLDFSSSEIKYFGYHLMHNWTGSSSEVKTDVSYSESTKNGSVTVKVRLDSFDSKLYSRDSNMLYYTDAIDYPEVVFKSTQAKVVNDSVYIEGNLTFHGVTKKIKTNAFIDLDRNPSINGTFYINLSDFNITRPSLMFVKIKDRMRIDYFFKNPN